MFPKVECCLCFLAIFVRADKETDGNPAQQYGSENEIPAGSCECYNPWLGETFQEHQGDPGKTCPIFCYVDCLGGCLDIKPAQGGGRCFSEEACKYGLLDGQCVRDRAFGRLLGNQMKLPKQNTPQLCADECFDNQYKFAGVQYSSQCFCGDEPPPDSTHVPAGECNTPCPGDPNQFCGATWRMNVYSTGYYEKPPNQLLNPRINVEK